MMKTYAFVLALVGTTSVQAQGWAVGTPMDMQISAITVYGGDCFPGVQAQLFMPLLPVSGIQYYYRVVNTNGGVYTMVPGPANVLNVGDTVNFPTTQISSVFNNQSFGGLELEVRAIGTPTTVGEAHPCEYNDVWISNLMLCNEQLTSVIQLGCATVAGTQGIAEAAATALVFVTPSATNGYQLQVMDTELAVTRVLDLQGRTLSTAKGASPRMDLSAQPDGVYLIQAERQNGQVLTQRFVLSR